ncbi:MAG: hypothetical protein ABSG59_22325 [Verrucomicrobiota bacterium]|jgi:anti-sigma factor RsiW
MTCEEMEIRILQCLDNQSPAGERLAVERHLAGCARCQAFERQLQQLDAALKRTVKSPALSPDFSARLRQRIQTEAALLSETQRAERKRQLQAEFEADLTQLRRKTLNPTSLLNCLGWAALGGLAGWLLLELAPASAHFAAEHGLDRFGQNAVFSWTITAVCLLIGLSVAFPRQLKRLWLAI